MTQASALIAAHDATMLPIQIACTPTALPDATGWNSPALLWPLIILSKSEANCPSMVPTAHAKLDALASARILIASRLIRTGRIVERERVVGHIRVAVPALSRVGAIHQRVCCQETSQSGIVHAAAHVDQTMLGVLVVTRETLVE